MISLQKLNEIGQSLWYDNIQRRLIETGELKKMIDQGWIRGITSNPSIFHNAIGKSKDYDSALLPMAWSGWTAEQIFDQLAVEDIRAAADLFAPLYQETRGADGFVSIEVSPYLATDTAGTLNEARRLWKWVNRPNLMVKIPATREGIPAIHDAIAEGINVNITLIFSRERYQAVMDAYLAGLEQRVALGLPIGMIASVASFFVSRVDSKVDARLEEIVRAEGPRAEQAAKLPGKAAIANARLAYEDFRKVFGSERFTRLKEKGAHVQRPLWASTSTKNPSYPDVLYVDELIGPDTVNTVPPQTLTAFLDHGSVEDRIGSDLDQARADLAELEALGIHMDEVTRQLEEEGVKAFSDAMTALLKTVEERRLSAVKDLGPLAERVAERVRAMAEMDLPRRLWAHDPSLWADDEVGQNEVRRRMGWIEAPDRSRALLPELARVVKEAQSAGFTHALVLGMGGSSLAPEVMSEIFGAREIYGRPGLTLQILDSTDPEQVRAAANASPVETTLYIVSSKSGGTSEVNAFVDFFWARARRKLGEKAAEHFIAITDPQTQLETLARERKFRRVILADPTVGGRFSALTAFGLLPAALLGLDAGTLLNRGRWMAEQCAPSAPAGRSPGLVMGAVLGEAALAGRDKLTLFADPRIQSFGAWLEQLVAESSGKQGGGIIPVDLEPPVDAARYGADRLFVYLMLDGSLQARVDDLQAAGHPALTFTWRDEYDLGAQFFLWEMATAVACSILQVNAFDQPDVQDSKDRTKSKVKAFQETRGLDEGEPAWEGAGGRVYGWGFSGLNGARTLADVVRIFSEQAREGDYIAINAYLPRSPKNFEQLQALRAQIAAATGRATTLGFGPRFLHSTGQLHKGGPGSGLFLQILKDPAADLEIPGQELTFGTLELAQALGDLESLLSRSRRAIRVHLTSGELKDLMA